MGNYALEIMPYGRPSFTIDLVEGVHKGLLFDRIGELSNSTQNIYSDSEYKFRIICPNIEDVQGVKFYVNDALVSTVHESGRIVFQSGRERGDRVFLDCYGYTEIDIMLRLSDGGELQFHSQYLPILVRKGALNGSVDAMAEYVYLHQEELLLVGDVKSKNTAGLSEYGHDSLEAKISLAEEIAYIYESSYGYFKTNSRFTIKKVDVVTQLEKVQYITPKTLQYTIQHPAHLRQVSGTAGIRVHNKMYHPAMTMTTQNAYSQDTVENRVVVGFIKTMLSATDTMLSDIDGLLFQIPNSDVRENEYVYSPNIIFAGTRRLLDRGKEKLVVIRDKFSQLLTLYSVAMQLNPTKVSSSPAPTAVFLSVPQYNRVFIQIRQWFNYGVYEFGRERFMFSFVKVSYLYECYLLAKFINYFKENGFSLTEVKNCAYPVSSRWKHKNTACNNTFVFNGAAHIVTLYYQPVIFDTDKSYVNGVGLYRNNTLSLRNESGSSGYGHYYVPDILIKVVSREHERYIICDAKFSTLKTVREYHITDLAYKYLFSISPISKNDIVSGLCIIYGQCEEMDLVRSVYDTQLEGGEISPFAETMPLVANVSEDAHYDRIRKLLLPH